MTPGPPLGPISHSVPLGTTLNTQSSEEHSTLQVGAASRTQSMSPGLSQRHRHIQKPHYCSQEIPGERISSQLSPETLPPPYNRTPKPQDPQTWSSPPLGPKFLGISVSGKGLSGTSFPVTHTNELTSHSRCQDTRRLRESLRRGERRDGAASLEEGRARVSPGWDESLVL